MNKNPVSEKLTLYYCITYYQVYIAIIKQLQNITAADIILSDAIPDYKGLQAKIGKKLFRKVILFEEKDIAKALRECFYAKRALMNKFSRFLLSKIMWIQTQNKIVAYTKSNLFIDLDEYDDIFVFGQGRTFAPYLFSMKKKYILVEDSIDYYKKGVNSYIDQNRMDYPRKFYPLNRLLDFFGIYYYMGGYSHAEKGIEVNSGENLVFSRCALRKIRIVSRKNLINNLTDEQKIMIFNIFISEFNFSVDSTHKTVLILTNPFLFDGLVETPEELVHVYKQLIKETCLDAKIFIKPHPRDFVEYDSFHKDLSNFELIDKNLPIEVFTFNEKLRFDKAIAISSTAIAQADYAKEKINLGMEWFNATIKQIRKRD